MPSGKLDNKIFKEYKNNLKTCRRFENFKLRNMRLVFFYKNKACEKQLSLIAGNLAQIYKDGVPITAALELVADILPNKIYKNSLLEVLKLIKQGKSLSQGFEETKGVYPKLFVGIVAIGENTGKLYEVLKGLSIYYDKSTHIKKEIKNASSYPLFILVSLIIVGIFLINIVLPNFLDIYKSMNINMPRNLMFLYDLNSKVKNNPLLALISIISWLSTIVIFFWCVLKKISVDIFIKIKIVKSIYEYILVMLFSLIISTGINISKALEYCENSISFVYLRKKIREINSSIVKGNTLTESLEKTGVFSKYTLAIVKIREETGSIDEGFKELTITLEQNLNEQIQKYLGKLSPIFMTIMAGIIVSFILEFVVPLFDTLKSGIR